MVSDHDFYITFSSNTSLLIKIGIITINTFLPTWYKFAYTCSIKINALRFGKLLECIFWILLVVEAFSLQKVVEMHEELVASWQEVRWIWWMRQNFIANLFNLKKNNIYLFIWLPWVLVAAHKIFSCGMWDLAPWLGIEPRPPALEVWCLSYWTIRKAPQFFILQSYEWVLIFLFSSTSETTDFKSFRNRLRKKPWNIIWSRTNAQFLQYQHFYII